MPPGPPAPGWLMSGLFEAIVAWRWTRRIAELDRRLRDAEHWLMMLQGLGGWRRRAGGSGDGDRTAGRPSAIPTPDATPSTHATAHQQSSPETRTAASPGIPRDTAVAVPPRGTERPPDSGRETQNPPAHGTESGTAAADPLPELLAVLVELPPEAAALLLSVARRLRPPP